VAFWQPSIRIEKKPNMPRHRMTRRRIDIIYAFLRFLRNWLVAMADSNIGRMSPYDSCKATYLSIGGRD
jgi:hypothetical protein